MAEEVREDYLESLEELTATSRPIIKTLTEIAQENVQYASSIVDAVEQHTMNCAPNFKLPAMYLIDSICKNNGEPFVSLLSPRIVRIFCNAFEVSSESTRMKLSEQFKTWTVPGSNGAPLFSHEILRELNDFMIAQQLTRNPPHMSANLPNLGLSTPVLSNSRSRLNQSALMVEINRLRSLLEQDYDDQFTERQLSLLSRIEAQVSGVVDPKLLPQIQSELENMKAARDHHLSRHSNMNKRRTDQTNRRDSRRPNNNNGHGSRNSSNQKNTDFHKERKPRPRGGVDKITGTNNVPIGVRKLAPQLSELEITAAAHQAVNSVPPSLSSESECIAPSQLDIVTACKTDATMSQIEQLYSVGLPLQCSTCGYRFEDTESGRNAKKAEMDWHFRANKDIREGHSRSRCWFLLASDWANYREEDEVYGQGTITTSNDNVMNNGIQVNGYDGPINMDKEREKYVEVPLDSNVVCPVCQEHFETAWSEEAENWVWMNAVEVDGHYFRATCYADPHNRSLIASILDRKL